MHYVCIVLSCENIAGASHIRSQLIHFIEAAIHYDAAKALLAEVANDEIVGLRLRKFIEFQVYARTQKPSRFNRFTRWPPINPLRAFAPPGCVPDAARAGNPLSPAERRERPR